MPEHEITAEDRAFLEAQGMREVEPGRWVSAWQDQDGREVAPPADARQLEQLMSQGRQMASLDAELSDGAGAWAQTVEPEQPAEPHHVHETSTVFAVLGIRAGELETLRGIDNTTFQQAVDEFVSARPFLTVDDALRAVLRRFGVRAKLIPGHVEVAEQWAQEGWHVVEIDGDDIGRFEVIA